MVAFQRGAKVGIGTVKQSKAKQVYSQGKSMRWFYTMYLMAGLGLGLVGTAGATAGKVDAEGCHQSAKQGHHCHPERAAGRGGRVSRIGSSSSSEEAPQARDKRLLRECKGLPNAGACLGYANASRR